MAAAFAGKVLFHGLATYLSILAPNASQELVAYFSMTVLTNVVTTRKSADPTSYHTTIFAY